MENTMTEHDMDPAAQQAVQGFRNHQDSEPDLSIDGFSESLVGKLLRVLSLRRS